MDKNYRKRDKFVVFMAPSKNTEQFRVGDIASVTVKLNEKLVKFVHVSLAVLRAMLAFVEST